MRVKYDYDSIKSLKCGLGHALHSHSLRFVAVGVQVFVLNGDKLHEISFYHKIRLQHELVPSETLKNRHLIFRLNHRL